VAFQIYKKEQGKYVRVGTAIGTGLVLAVLCYYTWVVLERQLPGGPAPAGAADAAAALPYKVYVEYAIPAVMFVALAIVGFFYMNKPVVVDFLIATESEMKKVSWSSRAELLGSTAVVLVTVFLLALFIWLADMGIIAGLSRGLGLW
jgi:preprotein translocase subunit SecE